MLVQNYGLMDQREETYTHKEQGILSQRWQQPDCASEG
jgi:hypothetical protein